MFLNRTCVVTLIPPNSVFEFALICFILLCQTKFYNSSTRLYASDSINHSTSTSIENNVNDSRDDSVQTIPLYTILLALEVKTVDYFSLNIKGAELEILKTIPFDKIKFQVRRFLH